MKNFAFSLLALTFFLSAIPAEAKIIGCKFIDVNRQGWVKSFGELDTYNYTMTIKVLKPFIVEGGKLTSTEFDRESHAHYLQVKKMANYPRRFLPKTYKVLSTDSEYSPLTVVVDHAIVDHIDLQKDSEDIIITCTPKPIRDISLELPSMDGKLECAKDA